MDYFPFLWDRSDELLQYVAAPITGASLRCVAERPNSLTLWQPNGRGLRIFSKMQDVSTRNEIGVLGYTVVNDDDENEELITLDLSFSKPNAVYKLLIAPAKDTYTSSC